MRTQITNYVRAGYPGIYLVSHEETRVEAELKAVASRVFGGFISWMQERTKPVFVVATANDVTALPPEFLRKGRWDDIMFVDLPNQEERDAIWKIQILKHGRDWSH